MSSADRWHVIRGLVERALDLPEGKREAFLEQACEGDEVLLAEARELLALDEEESVALRAPDAGAFGSLHPMREDGEALPARVGPWEIVRELGRGGMGQVLLARRAERGSDRLVALKRIRTDRDSEEIVERFERERRVLAGLEHPGIARLLDAGIADDGRPFLVMEYVEGLRLDHWCDRERLSVADRLTLFREVCTAADHAHRKLVVHRDLKPSNILVGEDGRPKLLDFGIVKVLDPESPALAGDLTRTSVRRLTLAYASPEQMRGEPITTASDTFSLGVILYQLLTGRLPLELEGLTPAEAERRVCEEEPTSPSTAVSSGTVLEEEDRLSAAERSARRGTTPRGLARLLCGDLDRVVTRAMQKDPECRYATALELAEDLRRYAAGLPVRARPDSVLYRARKFVSRNRLMVSVAGIVPLALIGGLTISTWQYRAADRARTSLGEQLETDRRKARELEARSAELRASRDFATAQKALAEERSGELEVLSAELLTRTEEAEAARLRAENSAQEVQGANQRLERQRGITSEHTRQVHGLAMTLILDVYTALRTVPGATEAMELVVEVGMGFLDGLVADAGHDRELRRDLAIAYVRLASVLGARGEQNLGRTADATVMSAKGLAVAEQLYAEVPGSSAVRVNLGVASSIHGRLLIQQGRVDEALAVYERSVEVCRVFATEEPPNAGHLHLLATAHGVLGKQQMHIGELARARASIDRALELFERSSALRPRFRLDLAQCHIDRAELMQVSEGPAGALPDALESQAITDQLLVDEPDNPAVHRQRQYTRMILATTYLGLGRDDEAVETLEGLVESARADSVDRPSDYRALGDLAEALERLAGALDTLARWEELGPHAEALLELGERLTTLDPDNITLQSFLISGLWYVGDCRREANRWAESRECYERALDLGEGVLDSGFEDGWIRAQMASVLLAHAYRNRAMASDRDRPHAERTRLYLEALRCIDRALAHRETLNQLRGQYTDPAGMTKLLRSERRSFVARLAELGAEARESDGAPR